MELGTAAEDTGAAGGAAARPVSSVEAVAPTPSAAGPAAGRPGPAPPPQSALAGGRGATRAHMRVSFPFPEITGVKVCPAASAEGKKENSDCG